jgi:hypothetical protein
VPFTQAPDVEKPTGTLLDTATVTDGVAWQDGGLDFDSYHCLRFDGEPEFCAPNSKDFSQAAGWQGSFRFGAYGGVTCRSVGLDQARMQAEVAKAFESNESCAVERGFLKTRFRVATDTDANGDPLWPAPTDITPTGGAVKPAVGIALLEGYARSVYVGMPTIHIPVVIGSLLLGVQGAEFDGTLLKTRLGSKLAVGAGYDFPNTGPTGANAATGEKWLYVTGEVLVKRGPVEVRQVLNMSNNDVSVMAERIYVGAVDCFAAAVRVQVTS